MEAAVVLVIALLVAAAGWQRLRRLEGEVADLRARLDVAPAPPPLRPDYAADVAAFAAARPVAVVEQAPADTRPPAPPEPPLPEPPARERPTFESLVGGRLPIWVGGAALVVAGFFLVRYSIESGLLGPGVRVALAGLFSVLLVAGGELAGRLRATRDDPRVGQALTGAGIASAYGTLYIAVATYGLVGAVAGFVLTVLVTALALALSLRQGPPTAIMALVGGFAAPLVAGVADAELGLLLAYLAVFIAALFGLAAHRGWTWLAVAALVAGFGWANLLLVLLEGRDTGGIAAFVVALAIGGTLAMPGTGATRTWLRTAPIVAGLVQLMVFAPAMEFGAVAWTFHLVLAAAALVLAWRDATLAPAATAAAVLVVVLIAGGLVVPERAATPVAAVVATLLFGGVGHALSRRSAAWSGVALIGIGGPVLVAHILARGLLADAAWTLAELALAGAAAGLAWRHRDRVDMRDAGLVGGTALAALLAAVALATIVPFAWAPAAVAPVLLATGWWANRVGDRDLVQLPIAVLAGALLLGAETFVAWAEAIGAGMLGSANYLYLPPLGRVVTSVALPALAGAALFALPQPYQPWRPRVAGALAVVGTAVLYTVLKQPLAVDFARFASVGLAERAVITLTFAAVGVALAKRTRFARTGAVLAGIAVARYAWFDVGLLNPAFVAQQVGAIPILNLAVLTPALLALAAWAMGWRRIVLALALVATLFAVRQAAHGTILTGPLGSGENWLYSAALLGVAIVWLWRGLASGDRTLRIAALGLLTLATAKVFLIDVAALGGVLRILSFLGLGLALIAIGWSYSRIVSRAPPSP